VTVSLFGSQIQPGFGLSITEQNQWEDATTWDTRMEESSARIFQSGLKIGGDVTAGGARGTITKVVSESS
jgi:hypothetical protein